MNKNRIQKCWRWLCAIWLAMILMTGSIHETEPVKAQEVEHFQPVIRIKKIKKLSIRKKSFILREGEVLRLKIKVKPKGASNQNLKYKSTNSKIIKVNAKGVVKAKRVGKAKVKVRTLDGSKKLLKIKFTVKPAKKDDSTESESTEVVDMEGTTDTADDLDVMPDETDIVEGEYDVKEAVPPYISNRLHIFFDETVSESRKRKIIDEIGANSIGQLSVVDLVQIELSKQYKEYKELKQYVQYLQNTYEEILYAEPEWVVMDIPQVSFDDPWYGIGMDWWLEAVDGPLAWEYAKKMKSIKIGILENGIDTGHEDLQVYFSKGKNEKENSIESHGTHVAGIIGATADNAKGIAGLAWMHKMYGYDWHPAGGQKWVTSAKIYSLYVNAVTDGCKIINLSLGTSGSLPDATKEYQNTSINGWGFATSLMMGKLLEKGFDFIVVQSAGNGAKDGLGVDAVNNGYFCSILKSNCYHSKKVSKEDILNRILVVGAVEPTGSGFMQTTFSNGGKTVNIAAPGKGIYSCLPGNSYGRLNGTSMAAPIVSATAAMVWSVNENLTGEDVRGILLNSSAQMAADNSRSLYAVGEYPMVNVGRAVQAAAENSYRIRLTWEDENLDLDAHLRGVDKKGADVHVYFGKNGYSMAELKADGKGKAREEILQITDREQLTELSFAVHNYTDCNCEENSSQALRLSGSGATVEVYRGNELLKSYSVPTKQKGTEWQVFSFSQTGDIIEKNAMKFTAQISHVLR